MKELHLHPLNCPRCGAPGVIREGTRVTDCERCGVRLCLTRTPPPRYEIESRLSAAEAASSARVWLSSRGVDGVVGRPELTLVPFHEINGRRTGVFERTVPERERVQRTVYSGDGAPTVETEYRYSQKADTKVLLADVQHLAVAAKTPWDLSEFEARKARLAGTLRAFNLPDAQRRATVFTEDASIDSTAERRFAGGPGELVAVSRRTLFFPFWSVPVTRKDGVYEIVVDGVGGDPVAWRLPEPYPAARLGWLAMATIGTLALGQSLKALFLGTATVDPVIAFLVGGVALAGALWRSERPDWRLRVWPETENGE